MFDGADLHVIRSGGKSERPAGVTERQSPRQTGLSVDQNVDRQAGVEIVRNVAAGDAMHDVKISVIGGEGGSAQKASSKAVSCKTARVRSFISLSSIV